ncbi:hypothetical protein [Corynebacterium sp. H130]|uniref:hypothetical protein n=1 Tax=Corynebacterium sp. H130 TaxID=3133444 RepID=UPI0030AF02B0
MSDSPFGDRNPPRTFDPEQSNGENAPANSGNFKTEAAERLARITSPETEDERDFEVEREFGREVN